MEKVFTKGLNGEKTKQTEIGEMPEGWEVVELDQISKIQSGGNAPQGEEYFKHGNLPFVRVQHFDGTEQYLKRWDTITKEAVKKYKLKIFKKDTIIFPKSGASIHLEKRTKLPFDCYVVGHLCCVTPESIDGDFLFYILKNIKFSNSAQGTSLPYLNLQNISKTKIIRPPLPEQKQIAKTLSTIQKSIEQHEAKKTTLQDFFKTALDDLMKGENTRQIRG